MIDAALDVFVVIVIIAIIVSVVRDFRTTNKARKLNRESEEINRKARELNVESEAINRRSRELVAMAEAAWAESDPRFGDDCDQEDGPATSTRNLVDPWAEIHHPDQHQPAAVQPAGLAANLYLCQCGQTHQRPETVIQPSEPTRAEHLTELESLGWAWNEVPTAYVGMSETEAQTVDWLKQSDDGDPGPRPAGRMICWHCQSSVVASPTIPSCTNPECPGKLAFLHEVRAEGTSVVRGSN